MYIYIYIYLHIYIYILYETYVFNIIAVGDSRLSHALTLLSLLSRLHLLRGIHRLIKHWHVMPFGLNWPNDCNMLGSFRFSGIASTGVDLLVVRE